MIWFWHSETTELVFKEKIRESNNIYCVNMARSMVTIRLKITYTFCARNGIFYDLNQLKAQLIMDPTVLATKLIG